MLKNEALSLKMLELYFLLYLKIKNKDSESV